MKVAVVGTGNVGWSLVECLARNTKIDEILVHSRSKERVTALIMDVASAEPIASQKISCAPQHSLEDCAIVVLTSGHQMSAGEGPQDVFKANLAITQGFFREVSLAPDAIVIALSTPVDDITVHAQKLSGLPKERVFGFGGDLDRNRLEYVLRRRGVDSSGIELAGEHGRNAIPVFEGDDYSEVCKEVRTFLSTLTLLAGQPRNLATAILLARAIETIITDSGEVHRICGYHPEHKIYLTWPFELGKSGVGKPKAVRLTESAGMDLTSLVAKRRQNA